MMNSWGNDQYAMSNMMNMTHMSGMVPNMVASGMAQYTMMSDMNQVQQMNQMVHPGNQLVQTVNQVGLPIQPMEMTVNQMSIPMNQNSESEVQSGTFIGPIQPEIKDDDVPTGEFDANGQKSQDKKTETSDKSSSRERSDRRERERDKGRRRSRSPRNRDRDRDRDRDHKRDRRNDRQDRSRNERRERSSKWDDDKYNQQIALMMQAQQSSMAQQTPMMQYGNMMPGMMQPQMDMTSMQQMMQLPGVNMMPNMLMMDPQMQMSTLPIYFSTGMVLPALPGSSVPPRRERPPGCRTIFIGGMPYGITEEVVTEIFQRFGDIVDVKLHKGVCHVRFMKQESVEQSFIISGCRLKANDQSENEATTLFIDYALHREDQNDYEKQKRKREPTPQRVEPYTTTTFTTISEKIKSDSDFAEAAPTLIAWLERGECNKKNASTFYSLVQASNNQLRRLFNEKMQIDEEFQSMKNSMKDKFAHILLQFEQVAKILTAAKLQRVSDHFSKQQRRNIEMWMKMTEELDNITEEFNSLFDEDEVEKGNKNVVSMEKYEQLRVENENLTYELEGYKNEAHLAKDEAERKFEKFKAHFIAQQALQNNQIYPPLPTPPMPNLPIEIKAPIPKPQPPPPLPDDNKPLAPLPPSEAKLISILTAFLMVHPLGASLDYLVSYVKSMVPNASQMSVHDVLTKYGDVFVRKTTGIGACIEHKWRFALFDAMRTE